MKRHVETQLQAYLDGELDGRERAQVEAHLRTCPACTAELARLEALQAELGATFDAALDPVRLPPAADRRIRAELRARTEPGPWQLLWKRRGLVAQALLAALVLVTMLATLTAGSQAIPLAGTTAALETLVLGQAQLSPGSRAALRVIVRDAQDGTPVPDTQVTVSLGRAPGDASPVFAGRTGLQGTTDVAFTVPEELEGAAVLVIETSTAGGTDRIVRPITIRREFRLLLSSDKPVYRPGQTIHVRVLALDGADLRPVAGEPVTFELAGPTGRVPEQATVSTSEFGIAAWEVPLPPGIPTGRYTLRARLGDTVSERSVSVGQYDLPAFRIELETGRPFYLPDQTVTGTVQALHFYNQPLAGAPVTLEGYVTEPERVPAARVVGEMDAQGRFSFQFDVPPTFGGTAVAQPVLFDLEIEVTGADGQQERIRRELPVAAQPLLIHAVPESGVLKPGIENVVYVMTATPDGQPAPATLTVDVAGEQYELATGPYGLAELRFVPTGRTAHFEIYAQGEGNATGRASLTFGSDPLPHALLLRSERTAYEVGDTLALEAIVSDWERLESPAVYLDVVRAEQTVATLSAPVEDGRAVFALDLDPSLAGTLELHAYVLLPDGTRVEDTRRVLVDAASQVAVAVSADRETYQPGETARLRFQTTLSQTGQPVQAALGIGIVDASVFALEEMPPGFVRTYFLLEQELLAQERRPAPFDPAALLEGEREVRTAQDVAARAAWAGIPATGFSLQATSILELPQRDALRTGLALRLVPLQALLALMLAGVVARGLHTTAVLRPSLVRALYYLLGVALGAPLVGLAAGWILPALPDPLTIAFAALLLTAALALLAGLALHGWRRRDVRVQLATGLVAAYGALGGALLFLAARGGDPGRLWAALAAGSLLLVTGALLALGQGLVLEGWRRAGRVATALALLLVLLSLWLPFVPGLDSDLARTVGSPATYAGPLGWLTGCSPAPETAEPEEIDAEPTAPPQEVEVTIPFGEEGEPVESEPAEPPSEIMPTPAPTAMSATPTPPPGEPFPLRQVFPETLYWNPEAVTGEDGRLLLELDLVAAVTTWQVSVVASTRDGELGAAGYDLIVLEEGGP